MVGIVIVSHSATLAEGVAELARGMAGEDVAVETAGGLDLPDSPLGTDAVLVMAAIERADSGAGVVVLMDLGSALLSAEMALEMLDPALRERVVLSAAPLVEGAVAAVVTARAGGSPAEVAAEAARGLAAKEAQLEPVSAPTPTPQGDGPSVTLAVTNPLGLHARPAARLVQTAAGFDAAVQLTNATTGRGPADARSLSAVAGLGVRQGQELLVSASGPDAEAALRALQELAGRGFDDQPPPAPPPAAAVVPAGEGVLAGLAAAPGIAVGPLRHLHVAEPRIPDEPAADRAAEERRLLEAVERTGAAIGRTREDVAARAGAYEAGIFDAHRLLLADEELLGPARRAVRDEGLNAAAAYARAGAGVAGRWRSLDDEYQRGRAADVEAVTAQVIRTLLGQEQAVVLSGPGIVAAPDLTPAETAALDRSLVAGIATAAGAPTSHSAILARSLGIPAVVALGPELLELAEGEVVALDGDAGTLQPEPDEQALAVLERRVAQHRESAEEAAARGADPAVTQDGVTIEVEANAGSPEDARVAAAAGADGIGLLRTEFVFLGRETLPDEEEQLAAYTEIAEALGGRPLTLRTLDVGADKPLPFLAQPPEANPFLGVRGLRLGLERPDVLGAQVRAALRAGVAHPLRLMFPMVTTLDELRRARDLVRAAEEELEARGEPVPAEFPVGMMVEVPAAALTAAVFAPEVDFFSIGTNDLTQYTLAAERGNERVAALADGLHPAVLRLIAAVTEAAAEAGIPVHVCGELGCDRDAIPVLVGLGVHGLSVAPPAIADVKERVRSFTAEDARALAARALDCSSAGEVRALVRDTAVAQRA